MDNPLTPNKIQRLMNLAEDKSFNLPKRRQVINDNMKSLTSNQMALNRTETNYESSSGILDLDRVEGFGESGMGSISLSKSTAFNPGEMTGRSTGTEDIENCPLGSARGFEEYGRHSMALDSITSHMDKQTSEINDIMRHSIATNYSFHSKRDLTADEASLVMREAPLPVQHSTQANFQESLLLSNSNMSVGAYFQNRCPEFGRILGNVDSPDRPSITDETGKSVIEVTSEDLLSSIASSEIVPNPNQTYKMDATLDSIPVRQPRSNKADGLPVANLFPANLDATNLVSKPSVADLSNIKFDKNTIPTKSTTGMKIGSDKSKLFTSSKPTDILLRNLQSSMRLVSDETECSMEDSLSISKIADYLGKQSNISVTGIMQLNNQTKQTNRKQPLTELQMNVLENKMTNQEMFVTNLKDTKNMETASSSGTVNTVISLDKLKITDNKDIPAVIVTRHSTDTQNTYEDNKTLRNARSNSPSSKSQSTLSTVQEVGSFKSGDSPLHSSKDEVNASHIPSPNLEYRELDKSVDWHDVLQHKRLKQECLAKEQWAEIITTPVQGFVGVSTAVSITITTLTDSWLTAKFEFDKLPNEGKDLTIELPRLPLLLSPGKTEKFMLHITSNMELQTNLPFTIYLKDASIDGDVEQKGHLEVSIKMPTIQALSCDGVNRVNFPLIQEKSSLIKHFVLISDCAEDLQLELSIAEGDSMFIIKSVQEINKNDVSRVLTEKEKQGLVEDGQMKVKPKANKRLCRLSSGNAIKVTITFVAPKLSDLDLNEKLVTFNGLLNVNLIGINTILKKVNLIASVGCASLSLQMSTNKLHLTHEKTTITLCNTGSISGTWAVKFKSNTTKDNHFPFKVSTTKLEICPGGVKELTLVYTGPTDTTNEGTLVLEDIATGNITTIEITGGSDKPKSFPIKTNYNNMSWVRAERKELSLKNSTDKRIQIRCQIVGEGFVIDSPGVETRGTFILTFGPCECRPLPIIFAPTSCNPYAAALHLVFDKNNAYSRKIKLHGCSSTPLRWSGQVTYGDTALVRAQGSPLALALYNKAPSRAFLAATVHFNLQYRFIASECKLLGGRSIINRRSKHTVTLSLPWSKLERRARNSDATALATVTVITGSEFTRRRILKILKDESKGELDVSLLPDHLKVLVETFEGEDPTMDAYLENFSETKASLNELIEGLQELTAQIDLPQDLGDENTILISDDTVVEHHTLCD